MPTAEEIKKKFFDEAVKKTGLTEAKIKSILQMRYPTFDVRKQTDMMFVLMAVAASEKLDQDKPTPKVKDFWKDEDLPKCPICGAAAIDNSRQWHYDRKRKTPPWTCRKGGILHYLYSRLNERRVEQGLPLLTLENIDEDRKRFECISKDPSFGQGTVPDNGTIGSQTGSQ